MMKQQPFIALLCPLVAVAMVNFQPAQADDLVPPQWGRNIKGMTYQAWDFSSAADDPPAVFPDAPPADPPGVNPFNPCATEPFPQMRISTHGNYMARFEGRDDVYFLKTGEDLTFEVSNCSALKRKYVHIQVTYYGGPPAYVITGDGGGQFNMFRRDVVPLADGWFHETTRWLFPLCPVLETILISPSSGTDCAIDQVVIDTLCSDEWPTLTQWGTTTMILLITAAGTLIIGRRTRRSIALAGMPHEVSPELPYFSGALLGKTIGGTLALAVAGLMWFRIEQGELPGRDIAGALISAILAGYVLHLWIGMRRA